jgi:hypothetical protein
MRSKTKLNTGIYTLGSSRHFSSATFLRCHLLIVCAESENENEEGKKKKKVKTYSDSVDTKQSKMALKDLLRQWLCPRDVTEACVLLFILAPIKHPRVFDSAIALHSLERRPTIS